MLLILAVVAISAIQNDGILQYAKQSRSEYENAKANEQATLGEYFEKIEESIGDGENTGATLTVAEAQKKGVLSATSNTDVYDEYGNKIVVPAGFKITEDASNVTQGIVIEDVSAGTETVGSQFVWIPVGDVYTTKDATKTEENTKKIELKRYVFADGTTDLNNDGTVLEAGKIVESLSKSNPSDELRMAYNESHYRTEGLKNESTANAHAKDIEGFINSAKTKGGYYIGRYEARTTSATARDNGDALTTVTCKKVNSVYNYVTQSQAAERSQAMYAENSNYTSDLINSFVWDTTLVFIQTFSGDPDYSRQTSLNTSLSITGTDNDKPCNIYDMASNCYEWLTESINDVMGPHIRVGGCYNTNPYTGIACMRLNNNTTVGVSDFSFRPILYLGL